MIHARFLAEAKTEFLKEAQYYAEVQADGLHNARLPKAIALE